MKISQRHFTLIELILGLSLGLILITSAFAIYLREIVWKEDFLKKEEFEQNLEYLHLRFNQILSSIREYKDLNMQNTNNVFGTSYDGNSLIFTYRNETDINPQFCGKVLGQIFLDEQQVLCLATWPLPSSPGDLSNIPCKMEVLLEGVEECSFSFYSLKEKQQDTWDFQNLSYPVFVHLYCTINDTLWTCSYEFSLKLHGAGDPILE